jgi:hypothetical protein
MVFMSAATPTFATDAARNAPLGPGVGGGGVGGYGRWSNGKLRGHCKFTMHVC